MMNKTLICRAISGFVLTVAGFGSALAQCSDGYCANDDSPVIGGFYVETETSRNCLSYYSGGNGNTCRRYGATTTSSNVVGSFGAVGSECPTNTARISMPNGYKANNGRLYKGGEMTFVCAKSDTY